MASERASLRLPALVLLALGVVAALWMLAPTVAAAASPQATVAVCIVQDKTRSTDANGIPQLEMSALSPLVDLLKDVGGEIGIAIVREASNRPLARLFIPTPPTLPTDKDQNINVISRARLGQQIERDYQARLHAWSEGIDRELRAFAETAAGRLATAADAPATDIWSALRRCDTFLGESAGVGAARRFLVAITDGVDTVGGRPTPLQSGATVLLVPGITIGSLTSLRPRTFESPSAAFRNIASDVRRLR